MKSSVKIQNLDGDPNRYRVASVADTVRLTVANLARIGQRLAHVGPLERLRLIQRFGNVSLAQ